MTDAASSQAVAHFRPSTLLSVESDVTDTMLPEEVLA